MVVISAFGGKFYQGLDIIWGSGNAKILNNGELITLSLDRISGSGFQSKNEYLFGEINMQLKLVPGDSAGTVTSYYNGDDWITRDGLIKIDRTRAPFTSFFSNFNVRACVWSSSGSSCDVKSPSARPIDYKWLKKGLHVTSLERLKWVQKNYMIYNYCTDIKRFPRGLPPECAVTATT
ncbi:conserved hypothetical protein [Ricinus communis]|uniref:xyloglucan:xyloglucosyl transferase n=1 Tax=Ricinus communis TaxID=3988 RepID=B9SJQ6_RICCO|nr:conserved hypothetical protein [Ricinus communis]